MVRLKDPNAPVRTTACRVEGCKKYYWPVDVVSPFWYGRVYDPTVVSCHPVSGTCGRMSYEEACRRWSSQGPCFCGPCSTCRRGVCVCDGKGYGLPPVVPPPQPAEVLYGLPGPKGPGDPGYCEWDFSPFTGASCVCQEEVVVPGAVITKQDVSAWLKKSGLVDGETCSAPQSIQPLVPAQTSAAPSMYDYSTQPTARSIQPLVPAQTPKDPVVSVSEVSPALVVTSQPPVVSSSYSFTRTDSPPKDEPPPLPGLRREAPTPPVVTSSSAPVVTSSSSAPAPPVVTSSPAPVVTSSSVASPPPGTIQPPYHPAALPPNQPIHPAAPTRTTRGSVGTRIVPAATSFGIDSSHPLPFTAYAPVLPNPSGHPPAGTPPARIGTYSTTPIDLSTLDGTGGDCQSRGMRPVVNPPYNPGYGQAWCGSTFPCHSRTGPSVICPVKYGAPNTHRHPSQDGYNKEPNSLVVQGGLPIPTCCIPPIPPQPITREPGT